METTEHIVEEYVRHVLKWFTNSNIKAKNGKEIDILAVDQEGNKYWIECGVSHKKQWSLKAKATEKDFNVIERKDGSKKSWRNKNSIDYFLKHKFENNEIKDKLSHFGFKNYKKIVVVWQIQDKEKKEVLEYATKNNIEVWELKDKMKELINSLGETYYSDDILRTLQLANKSKDN